MRHLIFCKLNQQFILDFMKCFKLEVAIAGLGIGLPAIMMIGWLIGRHYKRKYSGADADDDQFQSRNIYSDTFSNPDPEIGNVYFEVPLFSYKELQDATNKFDHARTLGDGGFGIVYYGKPLTLTHTPPFQM